MPIFFSPNGYLNIATDPSDLPEKGEQGKIYSEAMVRCKNMRIDQEGRATTRDGSAKVGSEVVRGRRFDVTHSALDTPIWKIVEQGGHRFTFGGQNIYRDEVSIKSDLYSAQWSAVLYGAYNTADEYIYACNGYERRRIDGVSVSEWGIEPPKFAPTLTAGSGAGLTGAYGVRYTYAKQEGDLVISESNPSPAANALTLSNTTLTITWRASLDPQVTHVRLYRTLAGGDIHYFDSAHRVYKLSHYTNLLDSELGAEVETDHDRPPKGSFIAGPSFNGYLFMVYQNRLYFSLPKMPDYWPSTYYLDISPPQFPGQCVVFWNGQPYYLTKNGIYYIQGTTAATFYPFTLPAITGVQGPAAACAVHGLGIYRVGPDGIYLFSGTDANITQREFLPIFRGEDTNGIPGCGDLSKSFLTPFQNKLYFGYPGVDDDYPTNILVMNLDNKKIAYYRYSSSRGDLEFPAFSPDLTNNRLLAGNSTGYIYWLENPDATDDEGEPIAWEVESKSFTLQTRAHFPRYIKYDVDATDADEATGAIILDDEVHHSHDLTGLNRETKWRQVETGNGKRASIRISGEGPATIYAAEME